MAEVSPSTVSRALHRPGRLHPSTEQRVRAVAAELGYRSNHLARALTSGRTETLAMVISSLTNPTHLELLDRAAAAAREAGYTLVFAESHESAESEIQTVERLASSVDGLVLVAPRIDDDTIRSVAGATPLVVINRDVRGVSCVLSDVAPGAEKALDHLAALGHRSIGYLTGRRRTG